MLADRLLRLADADQRAVHADVLRAFQLLLLLHVTARAWLWALRAGDDLALRALFATALALCALLGLSRRWARTATTSALVLLAIKLVGSFPSTSNHFFIEVLCVALVAFVGTESAPERILLLEALRWLTVIVLFYTGLQKVLYGTYFDGQFLGFAIATRPPFAALFGCIAPAEVARLRALQPFDVGAGPFAIAAPLAVAAANAAYLFEILAPAALLVRRTRPYAVAAALAFVVVIEVAARELMFGVLFANLLLLFLAWPLNRTLLPAFALLYAVLLGSRLDLLPAVTFN